MTDVQVNVNQQNFAYKQENGIDSPPFQGVEMDEQQEIGGEIRITAEGETNMTGNKSWCTFKW